MSEPQTTRLIERYDQPTGYLQVDREKAVIRNVAICNSVSVNGRNYTPSAMADIQRLCERRPVAMEHEDLKSSIKRRYMDRNGQLRNCRLAEGRVVGDWHLNKDDSTTARILTDAEEFPENLCLSIEIPERQWEGGLDRSTGKVRIDRVREMLDVSVVAFGGTTRSLKEHVEPNEELEMTTANTPSVDVSREIADRLREQEERRKTEDTINALKREVEDQKALNARLTEERDRYKAAEEKRVKAARIVEQAKELKAGEISAEYAESLAALPDESITLALQDRARLLEQAGGQPQQTPPNPKASHFGPSVNPPPANEQAVFGFSFLK